MPPLVRDALVLNRFEAAIAQIAEVGALADAPPGRELVPYALAAAAQSLTARCHPSNAHVARVGSMVRFGDMSLTDLRVGAVRDGVTIAPTFDRIMAYPELAVPAYRLLARYDRTRLLPGVDAIPPDSVTLLETNPRFVAAFLAGVNHELNRELLWRRYPTDQRGTPVRRFWDRLGGPSATDVPPMHQWAADRSLVDVAGGESNLVLLIRGELLRRYPNTVVLAIPASGPGTPSSDETMVKRAIFAGFLDPDVSFFGFDLADDDLRQGDGWFFALQEQITEPRFGLDESRPAGGLTAWRQAAWPDTGIAAATPFTVEDLRAVRGGERAAAGARRRRDRRRGPVPEPGPGARARSPPRVHRGGLMPDLDLERIASHRTELGALATELTALGAELAARQAELADLRVTGRGARALERAERRVAELERRRAALHERRSELSGLVGVAASGLLDEIDPETAVESLDGKVPVALLPVRIETRFADANTTLHIRIFPDQVHLDAHEPAFTDDERAGAEWYWNERWPALDDAARAERAWTTLAGRFRPGRARYLLDTLRPANLDRAPDEPPAFPDDRHAGQLVDAGGRGHRPPRALGGDRVPGHLGGVPDLVGPGARSPGRRPVAGRAGDAPSTRRRCPRPARAGRVPLGGRSRRGARGRHAAHRPRQRHGLRSPAGERADPPRRARRRLDVDPRAGRRRVGGAARRARRVR